MSADKEGPDAHKRAILLGASLAGLAAMAQPAEARGDSETSSPWGDNPRGPPEQLPAALLPATPRAYSEISSYHAHIYFTNDTAHRAVRIRDWVIERFRVELGEWNAGPRGPHTSPSFYFGFTTEQSPIIIPWLMLNHLGLKILIHPNTDDPYADHLINALWIGGQQSVNAFGMPRSARAADQDIERIYPNIIPTATLET